MFYGSVNVTVQATRNIIARTNNNTSTNIIINKAPLAPTINRIKFTTYPSGQTEVKEDDNVNVILYFDGNGTEPVSAQIDNFGIAKNLTVDLSLTELD